MDKPIPPERKTLAQNLSAWIPRYKAVVDAYVRDLLVEANRMLESAPALETGSTAQLAEHFLEFAAAVSNLAEEIDSAKQSVECGEFYLRVISDNIEPDEAILAKIGGLAAYLYMIEVAARPQDSEAKVTPAISDLNEMWITSEKFAIHLQRMAEIIREYRGFRNVANLSAAIDPAGITIIQGANGTAVVAQSVMLEQLWGQVNPEDKSH